MSGLTYYNPSLQEGILETVNLWDVILEYPTRNKKKANWIGHILRRNCLLKQVIEGKIKGEMEVARRRGRRRKKLLDDQFPSKTSSRRKDKGGDGNGKKTRKKT